MKNPYFFTDFFSKVIRKLSDYLIHPYWYIRLGKIGRGSRIKRGVRIIGNAKRVEIGSNQTIYHNCVLAAGEGKIIIGNDSHISIGCYMNATSNNIIIGNGVKIGTYTQIYSYSYELNKENKMEEEYKGSDVVIKDHVHLGAGAVILPGVTIGEYAIVAPNAIVKYDVPPYSIVAGMPAKEIGRRK